MKSNKNCSDDFDIKNFAVDRKQSYTIEDLLQIVKHLRGESGCPWDRKQTHTSIRNNMLEEAYEAVEAIDFKNNDMLCEELGDLLLQVVFHADIEREKNNFNFDNVCDGICRKLIERHPHIFGDESVKDSDEVLSNWDAIKRKTKRQTTVTQSLKSIPKPLPQLMKTRKIQDRVTKAGMPNKIFSQYIDNMRVYLCNLTIKNFDDISLTKEQIGEILFAVVALSKISGVDAEEALYGTSQQFVEIFSKIENSLKKKNISLSTCKNFDSTQINNLFTKQ